MVGEVLAKVMAAESPVLFLLSIFSFVVSMQRLGRPVLRGTPIFCRR